MNHDVDDVIESILSFIIEPWELVPIRCVSVRWRVCVDRRLQQLLRPYLAAMRIRCCGTAHSYMSLCYARSMCTEHDYNSNMRDEPATPRYICARCGDPKYQIGDYSCCRLRRLRWQQRWVSGCHRVGILLILFNLLQVAVYALRAAFFAYVAAVGTGR